MEANSRALRPSISDALGEQNVRLPLSVSADDIAVIWDADGKPILVVDVNRERPDEEVAAIATLLADAVNTAAGVAEPTPVDRDTPYPFFVQSGVLLSRQDIEGHLRQRIERLIDPDHRVRAAEERAIAAEKKAKVGSE